MLLICKPVLLCHALNYVNHCNRNIIIIIVFDESSLFHSPINFRPGKAIHSGDYLPHLVCLTDIVYPKESLDHSSLFLAVF